MTLKNNIENNSIKNKVNTINGVSLFSNVGIDETYFEKHNIKIVCANELLEKRAKFYRHLYPNVNMICGDITDDEIFNKIIEEYKKNNCEFLIATPFLYTICKKYNISADYLLGKIDNPKYLNS